MRLKPGILACFLSAGVLAWPTGGFAAPPGYQPLPLQKEVIDVEGKAVTLRYRPAFKGRNVAGNITLDILVDGDLGELQQAVGGILDGDMVSEACGDRVNVSSTKLGVTGDSARLSGAVHYEKWACITASVPTVRGLKVTMQKKTVRAKAMEQNVSVCIDLIPRVEEGGQQISFVPTVTCSRLSSHTILGKIGSILGLEQVFRRLAQSLVDDLRERLVLTLPGEIRSFGFEMRSARFFDRGDGVLGLEVGAGAVLTKAEFRELLATLAR